MTQVTFELSVLFRNFYITTNIMTNANYRVTFAINLLAFFVKSGQTFYLSYYELSAHLTRHNAELLQFIGKIYIHIYFTCEIKCWFLIMTHNMFSHPLNTSFMIQFFYNLAFFSHNMLQLFHRYIKCIFKIITIGSYVISILKGPNLKTPLP